MSNKTITINPSLFSLSTTKTKKNKEKKLKPPPNNIISPNVLKNKLLKRIKEHKQKETSNLDNNKKSLNIQTNDSEASKFSDEFHDSIEYLQTLSKQKKWKDEKKNNDLINLKRKEDLERKTVKNYERIEYPHVNLELPEELQMNTESFIETPPIFTVKQNNLDNVPYGILKGGSKPTYRNWAKTQKNNIVLNPNSALVIDGYKTNNIKLERENRLNHLREKLKMKELENNTKDFKPIESIIMTQNLIKKPNVNLEIPTSSKINIEINEDEEIIAMKKIIKKTTMRKYTLGKSIIKRKVGVLIKDRGTRKKILNAQKELKRKSIIDIKTYLREHNLIKIGSNAPNDVIRKLYESAMLSGEITNSNSENLLYNFSKEEKEL